MKPSPSRTRPSTSTDDSDARVVPLRWGAALLSAGHPGETQVEGTIRMSQYVLAHGTDGADRLRLLSRVLYRTTEGLLLRAGLAPGLRCLDVG